ncbi:MAG: ABC transporter ATP-binding protein [Methanoregula sp.]|jgi:tungstate transport system ATP-binding protein|uniref:ABC transporter ATP-binding protein n=1 Tax=Methanoregula sp. TaxID=2052170 RepID=UPI003D10FE6D
MSTSAIETHTLSKNYDGRDVIRDVSFSIRSGEIFGIIGPSGSGKSTLLRLLDLIEQPTGGRLTIFGTDALVPDAKFPLRRRMALLSQKPVIFSRSVSDNIALGMEYRRKTKPEISKAVTETLDAVGLAGYGKRSARTLSGGEGQRMALARAVVTEPEILFLDEPTTNLDPVSAERIEEIIIRLNREKGITVVICTHDMIQGQRLAHRIGVIMDGALPQVGTTKEIFHQPTTTNIARFVGVKNMYAGVITENHDGEAIIDVAGKPIAAVTPFLPRTKVTILFRAEDVTLHLEQSVKTSARNVFRGIIKKMVPSGPFVDVIVDCGIDITALVTIQSSEDLGLTRGMKCWVSFKATAVHVLEEQ